MFHIKRKQGEKTGIIKTFSDLVIAKVCILAKNWHFLFLSILHKIRNAFIKVRGLCKTFILNLQKCLGQIIYKLTFPSLFLELRLIAILG